MMMTTQPVDLVRDTSGDETLEMWRDMRNTAGRQMEHIFLNAPKRKPDETLTRWVERVREAQNRAVLRWRAACDECARLEREAKGL